MCPWRNLADALHLGCRFSEFKSLRAHQSPPANVTSRVNIRLLATLGKRDYKIQRSQANSANRM